VGGVWAACGAPGARRGAGSSPAASPPRTARWRRSPAPRPRAVAALRPRRPARVIPPEWRSHHTAPRSVARAASRARDSMPFACARRGFRSRWARHGRSIGFVPVALRGLDRAGRQGWRRRGTPGVRLWRSASGDPLDPAGQRTLGTGRDPARRGRPAAGPAAGPAGGPAAPGSAAPGGRRSTRSARGGVAGREGPPGAGRDQGKALHAHGRAGGGKGSRVHAGAAGATPLGRPAGLPGGRGGRRPPRAGVQGAVPRAEPPGGLSGSLRPRTKDNATRGGPGRPAAGRGCGRLARGARRPRAGRPGGWPAQGGPAEGGRQRHMLAREGRRMAVGGSGVCETARRQKRVAA
jgi:hypothetical protein